MYEICSRITAAYREILGGDLSGIYVHGSIAFGCFNWAKSDIDFLVVLQKIPSLEQKEALIRALLALEPEAPPKGFEMSVVLECFCKPFVYPTPYELHYSITHRERCKQNLTDYCRLMSGTDSDLAAHIMVINQVGMPLCGKPVAEVFGEVPREAYLDSIRLDVENAEMDILENPVYVILNLCRVLAFQRDGLVLSKEGGGIWGARNVAEQFLPLVQAALSCYRSEEETFLDRENAQAFCEEMLRQIFAE